MLCGRKDKEVQSDAFRRRGVWQHWASSLLLNSPSSPTISFFSTGKPDFHIPAFRKGQERRGDRLGCLGKEHHLCLLAGETFLKVVLVSLNTIEMSWGGGAHSSSCLGCWKAGMLEGRLWLVSGIHLHQNWGLQAACGSKPI